VIRLSNGAVIGGDEPCIMGGPCSVESEEQLMTTAAYVAETGCRILRGGAFKPRTSPYEFQGLGAEALRLLAKARDRFGLAIITEALDADHLHLVAEVADVIQIGARNMQNYALLRRVGQLRKPVMLKRGPSATIKEWLLAAEYIASEGNPQIMLCERGIRSFDDMTRNLLDVSAIPLLRGLTHLPIIADPSHGTGRRALVMPMARASVAAGAHGVIVETHPRPDLALSDGPQALLPDAFARLVREVHAVHRALLPTLSGSLPFSRRVSSDLGPIFVRIRPGTSMAEIPAPNSSDSEDVSWALETANARWKRGDREDALSWVKRAASAAREAQQEDRAAELERLAALLPLEETGVDVEIDLETSQVIDEIAEVEELEDLLTSPEAPP
jgi:3-deoxy-7-phosphoheptulonate synthase